MGEAGLRVMCDPHNEPAFVQQPRHHKTVAAIVAGAAQNGDRARLEACGDGIGHHTSGIFHQSQRRRPMRHREGISPAHFRSSEDFVCHFALGTVSPVH